MHALAVYEVHVTLSREDHVIVYPNGSVYSSLRRRVQLVEDIARAGLD